MAVDAAAPAHGAVSRRGRSSLQGQAQAGGPLPPGAAAPVEAAAAADWENSRLHRPAGGLLCAERCVTQLSRVSAHGALSVRQFLEEIPDEFLCWADGREFTSVAL